MRVIFFFFLFFLACVSESERPYNRVRLVRSISSSGVGFTAHVSHCDILSLFVCVYECGNGKVKKDRKKWKCAKVRGHINPLPPSQTGATFLRNYLSLPFSSLLSACVSCLSLSFFFLFSFLTLIR